MRRTCRINGQEDLYLFLLPHYGTQGRAGARVSVCSELDQRAIVHWRSQVNIVVASVDGHMADDQVRTSSKVARGTPKWRSL